MRQSKTKHEDGSIAPLGILSMALTLTCALVVLCAGSLFQQQRTLNAIADALALTIARDPANEADSVNAALRELQSSKTANLEVSAAVIGGDGVVFIRICQPARVGELLMPKVLSEKPFTAVCAEARAGKLANA